MDEMLKALYNSFYTPPEMIELSKAVETNRAMLREHLAKEDRKVILRIVDDMSMIALERSYDSFICGFKLAWQMENELNHYNDRRSTPAEQAGLNACFLLREADEK